MKFTLALLSAFLALPLGCGGKNATNFRAPQPMLVEHTPGGVEVRLLLDWTPRQRAEMGLDAWPDANEHFGSNDLRWRVYPQIDVMVDQFREADVTLPLKAVIVDFRQIAAGHWAAYVGDDLVVAHFSDNARGLPELARALADLAIANGAKSDAARNAETAAYVAAIHVGLDP